MQYVSKNKFTWILEKTDQIVQFMQKLLLLFKSPSVETITNSAVQNNMYFVESNSFQIDAIHANQWRCSRWKTIWWFHNLHILQQIFHHNWNKKFSFRILQHSQMPRNYTNISHLSRNIFRNKRFQIWNSKIVLKYTQRSINSKIWRVSGTLPADKKKSQSQNAIPNQKTNYSPEFSAKSSIWNSLSSRNSILKKLSLLSFLLAYYSSQQKVFSRINT